jgi:hypothetical protein
VPKKKSTKSKAKKPDKVGDDEIMFWFGNQLMSYFGDDDDDDVIFADLREMFPDYPFSEDVFRRGVDLALALSEADRVKLVQGYANRYAPTGEAATEWLSTLRDRLFGS